MPEEFAFPAAPFIPPLRCSCLQKTKKKDTPLPSKKPPSPTNQKTKSSYIPGCAGKGRWARKSEDISLKLLNARSQVETYHHSPTCKPGMGFIPPPAWESGKPGCTKLLWRLRLSQTVAQSCFCLFFQLCYLV